jgi:glutamyl-tRNA reductase
MAPAEGSKCPIKRLSRVIYVHVILLLSLLGFSTALSTGGQVSSRAASCPFARASHSAFQSPASAAGGAKLLDAAAAHPRSAVRGCGQTGSSMSLQSCPFAAAAPLAVTYAPRQRTAGMRRKRPSTSLHMSAVEKQAPAAAAAEAAVLSPQEEALLKQLEKAKRKEQANNPLQVHVIGLSHHNAAVEVRERLAVPEPEWNAESARLCTADNIAEAAVLSTCNRFEVYVASHDAHAAIHEAITLLQQRSGLPPAELRRSLFILSAEDAVWHILRVSAGLDSLVVGEGQILSQVRQCYLHGTEEDGCAGKVVARLLNTAVSAGKRVRSETSISKGAVSISSAAAEFSKFRSELDLGIPFDQARITIVGAGTMSRLLLIHLQSLGVKAVTLVNRSMPKCLELQAEFPDLKFDVRLSDQLEATLLDSDVVYTSTSATGCIVTQPQLEALGAGKAKPLMFVDISVPRNVESECNEVEGVFAYDVDDLKMVSQLIIILHAYLLTT